MQGKPGPPADLRYLKRKYSVVAGDCASARVISYLESLYESVAETLPDVRDDPSIVTKNCVVPADQVQGDGYSERLGHRVPAPDDSAVNPKRKLRKRKMSLILDPARQADPNLEVRYLPPGSMRDHWETMISLDPRSAPSFKTFWATWHREYGHLRFRSSSSHAQCSTCLRHKLLVRELSHHLLARQNQQELLAAHLTQQYRDRQIYWSLRGSSRLRSLVHVTLILDGMDQCKFCYPRSSVLQAKDLCNFQRPKLQVTGCLLHGYILLFAVSDFFHAKDSSASAELIVHMLHRLQGLGIQLCNVHLHLQSDNTTREVKNNTCLRLLGALVSHRSLT